MFKMLVFISLFLPSVFGAAPSTEPTPCSCLSVDNLQKTGQSSSSFTYSWNSGLSGVQYKVWYVRREDGYVSDYFYTSSTSYHFTGLSTGHYTFYFQTLCEGETSGYIGIEDTISA